MIALYLALLNDCDGKRTHIIDEIFLQNSSKFQSEVMSNQKSQLQSSGKMKDAENLIE